MCGRGNLTQTDKKYKEYKMCVTTNLLPNDERRS